MFKYKKYLDFYIKSSLHVGLAVFALVQLSVSQFNWYSAFVFFGTVVGYNFLKYWNWFVMRKVITIQIIIILSITLVAAVVSGILFSLLNHTVQLHLFISLILVLFYPRIRKIGRVKPFFVSLVVTYITVFIPLMNHERVILLCLERFLLLSSIILPFEISDCKTDSVSLKTIPHLYGIVRTKLMGYVLVGLFWIVSFYIGRTDYLLCLIFVLLSTLAIYYSSEKKSWYYTSLWVESLPIFFWILTLLTK